QAVIQGTTPDLLETTVKNWLFDTEADSVIDILANLNNALNRAASIYQPTHPLLADTVHNWIKVLLEEHFKGVTQSITADIPNEAVGNDYPAELWQLLERSRIALTGQTIKLPEDWQDDVGNQLWQELKYCIKLIEDGYN
ncbi:MAG: hypothetical protein IMF12_08730, partial [Proteobacteria bacterium]|nr:hypothetical protein [Pseudomonadota bacterium]